MRPSRVLSVAALAALVGCGGGDGERTAATASPTEPSGARRVVVDTDGGSDDAMALLYLLQHPGVDVVAVTVSGTGIVHCDPGVDNVAGLIDLAAPSAEIPIACGAEEPTAGTEAFPDEWREQADQRYGGILPAATAPRYSGDATEVLAAIAEAGPPVTVLTLGPLTNLADAFAAHPDLPATIEEVVVMGGAFDTGGNVFLDGRPGAEATEWNIFVDPEAAQAVLDAEVPVTFVPLDVQVPVDAYVLRALAENAVTPPAQTVVRLLESSPFFVSGEFAFWDPLAAAAVAQPDLFSLTPRTAMVATEGEAAGRTVSGSDRPVRIATAVDSSRFVGHYLATLDGRGGVVAVDRDPDTTVSGGDQGCTLTAAAVEAGPSVVALDGPMAAAVGVLAEGYTEQDINAYLASSPGGPPPWFPLTALLQEPNLTAAYADLVPGELTIVCIKNPPGSGAPAVSGTVTLAVAPAA